MGKENTKISLTRKLEKQENKDLRNGSSIMRWVKSL